MGADQTTSYPPPPPREGRRVLSYMADLYKWLKRNQAIAGVGLISTQTESGKIFRLIEDPNQLTPPHPFQPTQTGPLKVKVASGMWWGQTYQNESFDTENVRPLWMNEHRLNAQEFTVSDNTTTIILVKVTYAYFQSGNAYQWKISSITFTTDTSASPDLPGNNIPLDNFVDNIETPPFLTPPYEKYWPIVYVEAASGEISTIIPLVNRDVHDPIAGSVFHENP